MSTSFKRPGEKVSGCPEAKISRPNWHYVLEEESDLPTDEDEESVHSVQGKETDFAKDTSDTSSSYYVSGSPMNFELEVESLSEKENPLGNRSLSSDVEAICAASVLVLCNEGASTFADSSTDCSSFDPEIPRADYWTCVQCKNKNNNPCFRYCDNCYKVRKNFFPPRPRRKRKRNKMIGQKAPILKKSISNASTVSISDLAKDDEPIAGPSHLSLDSGISSLESCLSSFNSKSELEIPTNSIPESNYGYCITCLSRPKNGIFLHGTIGHICCCYKCALKVWTETQRCPICNCKVRNVLKAIVH